MTHARVFGLVALALMATGFDANAAESGRERRMQAAFVRNFMLFTTWPAAPAESSQGALVVGVVGNRAITAALRNLENTTVGGRVLSIRPLSVDAPAQEYQACRLLFVGASAGASTQRIINAVGNSPVLSVGTGADFLERGGIIRLDIVHNRMRFAINQRQSDRVGLRFRAKLLRLAATVSYPSAAANLVPRIIGATTWPTGNGQRLIREDTTAPGRFIDLAVIGNEKLAAELGQAIGLTLHARSLRVSVLRGVPKLKTALRYHAIVVGRTHGAGVSELLDRISDAPVLTVGTAESDSRLPCMVRVVRDGGKSLLRLNLHAIRQAGLSFDSAGLDDGHGPRDKASP